MRLFVQKKLLWLCAWKALINQDYTESEQLQDKQFLTKGSGIIVCLIRDIVDNMTCPADFQRVVGESSCYRAVSPTLANDNQSLDYDRATRDCQSYGAHLVSIESIDKQRHTANFLPTQPGLVNQSINHIKTTYKQWPVVNNEEWMKPKNKK